MVSSQDQTLRGMNMPGGAGGAQVFFLRVRLACRSAHSLHTGGGSQLSSAQHEILVKVDAKQAADELAGSHPPGKESKDPSEEDWGEDRT